MSTRQRHRRLDDVESQTGADSGRLVTVMPGQEPDPPSSFPSEEAARSYFDEREEEPTLVILDPIPDDKKKE